MFYQNVTREEKDLIVKAMGLAQGHWFKCPKGENYCQSSQCLANKVFLLDYKGRRYQIIFPINNSMRASLKNFKTFSATSQTWAITFINLRAVSKVVGLVQTVLKFSTVA